MSRYNAMTGEMDFGMALDSIKAGRQVARSGWVGKDMLVRMQDPSPNSKMTLPYIYIKTSKGDLIPWVATQEDLLSYDWREVI